MHRKLVVLMLLLMPCVLAQESENYMITDYVLTAAGNPPNGSVLASTNWQINHNSFGTGLSSKGVITSGSFQLSTGIVCASPPPGEVVGLIFTNAVTLQWNPEKSVGTYNLYRDLFSGLEEHGTCEQYNLTDESTTDVAEPPMEDGYFYLVTAVNRLGEEGTKGADSTDTERHNLFPCP